MADRITLDDMNARLGAPTPAVPPAPDEPAPTRRLTLDEMQARVAGSSATPGSVEPWLEIPELSGPPSGGARLSEAASDLFERGVANPARAAVAGYRAGASDLYRLGANVVGGINRAGNWLTEKTGVGIPSTSPESGFGAAERTLRDWSERMAPSPEEAPSDLAGKVYAGIGRAPVDIAQYVAGGRLLGPIAGMGAVDAAREADKGVEAAAHAGAKGALLGGVLHATSPLTIPARVGTVAGVGAGQTALEGGDLSDVVASGAVMGGLGALGGGGRTRLRDLPGTARLTLAEMQAKLRGGEFEPPQRIEPTLESAPPAQPAGEAVARPGAPAGEAAPQPRAPTGAPAPQPAGPTDSDIAITPRGRRIEVRPEIVEAADLVTSHGADMAVNPDFPPALQPRDRARAASADQVREIAANLQPELLGRSASAGEGAPIIGPDGIVESGNARTLAIRQAYTRGLPGAERYRTWLADQGYDLTGIKEPVLVRRRVTELDDAAREAFTREANERATLGMAASEQAAADAKAIDAGALALYRGGDLNLAANRRFRLALVDKLIPAAERGSALTAEGALSQQGLARLQNALFSRAYGEPELLARLREDTETEVKAIGEALVDAAPAWAALRGRVEDGATPARLDPTTAVIEALRLVQRARQTGTPVRSLVAQHDMFAGPPRTETREALALFFRDKKLRQPRSRQQIADALRFVADQGQRGQVGPGLFPGAAEPTAADLLRLARQRLEGGGSLLPDAAESRAVDSEPRAAEPAAEPRAATAAVSPEPARSAVPAGDALPEVAEITPGANYTGMRPQVYDATIAPTGRPVRREEILAPLFEAFGVPLYQGRIKSERTLGFFRKPVEEVRIKRTNDIETAAHEIAHLLDSRVPEIRAQWRPANAGNKDVRAELAGVSYDKSKLYEGFAEFVRLWTTQPAEAHARAPKFHGWWEDFVARSEYGPALRRAQRDMTSWFAQAALDRARSKIGAAKAVNAFLDAPLDRFRQSVSDDLHGVMRMERDMTGGLAPVGAYETARLARASASITDGTVEIGGLRVNADGSHGFAGKGLREILKPVAGDLDDFLLYAVGRSARELMGQGREHLFTPAEIKAMTALERPEFRQAFDDYQVWNAAILDFAEAKGLINPAVRQMFKRSDYLPFWRVGAPGGGPGQGVQGAWSGIKALTGGTENIRDVLGNMLGNARMLIDAALKNEARAKVADLAAKEGGAKFMVRIPTEERAVAVHSAEVERAILEALGVKNKAALGPEEQATIDKIVDGMRPMAEFILRGQAPAGRNVVAVLRQGKPAYYEVADPILLRALTSLDRPIAHWAIRALAVPKRVGQASITLAVDFMAANFARDTLMGAVMSRHGFRPIVDSARGMKSRIAADQNYRDFVANGGGLSSFLLDEGAFRSHLRRFYERKGVDYRTVLDTPSKLLYGLERIAESFEMATRLGEFRRAVEKGEHPRHAAYSAREVSTDFAMRGDSRTLGFIYDTALFFKAGINGMDRLYRGLAHDPNRGAIVAKAGLIALLSAGLYALNRGNPLYDQLEDWDRDTHWHFFVPKPDALKAVAEGREVALKDRYLHLKYPKIWEIGALASLAERGLAGILDGMSAEDAKAMAAAVLRAFNLNPMPHVAMPIIEGFANWDTFRDRPIETRAMQELQPWARATPYTSQLMRRAGEATRGLPRSLHLAPAQAEHLLRGYFNTFALYGLALTDAMLFDTAPNLRLDQYPVLRRFYAQEPARRTRFEGKLFDTIHEANEARRTMKHLEKRWRPDLADELEVSPENRLYGQAQRIEKRFRVFRQEAEQVVTAETLDQVQKLAQDRARDTRQVGLVARARRDGAWNDVGALKAFLLDDIAFERNEYARQAFEDLLKAKAEVKPAAPRRPTSDIGTPPATGAVGSGYLAAGSAGAAPLSTAEPVPTGMLPAGAIDAPPPQRYQDSAPASPEVMSDTDYYLSPWAPRPDMSGPRGPSRALGTGFAPNAAAAHPGILRAPPPGPGGAVVTPDALDRALAQRNRPTRGA